MASFYAELHLNGRAYPVRLCHFALHQDTDDRGRVTGKVRHGPLGLTLDVPDGDELLAWAAAPFKPLDGEVVFYNLTAQVPHETIAFTGGHCVDYQENFADARTGAAAYLCHLVITAAAFEMRAGGPAVPRAAAMRGWAGPDAADETPTPGLTSTLMSSNVPNYATVTMDPDYIGEETGAVWGSKVQYLSPTDRGQYLLKTGVDGLMYNAAGVLFDTEKAATVEEKGKAIFVMSPTGEIYASMEHKPGFFHHSTFLAGAPVAAAGEIEVLNGKIVSVSNRSGHYAPDQSFTNQFIEQLWRNGAKNTDLITIQKFDQ